ncbi:MAG: hypothetical protein WC174_05370 [Bacilli bacterium]
MKVILYSTGCPICLKLKELLKSKNIFYDEITDIDIMLNKGFDSVPILEIDGKPLDYKQATQWIKERNGN